MIFGNIHSWYLQYFYLILLENVFNRLFNIVRKRIKIKEVNKIEMDEKVKHIYFSTIIDYIYIRKFLSVCATSITYAFFYRFIILFMPGCFYSCIFYC